MRRRSECLARRLAPALLAAVLLAPAPARSAEPVEGTVLRELTYGDVLFHFYSGDDFEALTRLLVARSTDRVRHHDAESELLLGGLYLQNGQHDRAEAIFERLLASRAEPAVRDRAWYWLGKLRYRRGLHEDALAAFARVGDALPKAEAAELPMLVAQAHMGQGRFAEAAKGLDGWTGPEDWLPYARYNLGVALLRLGRLAEGAVQLEAVGRIAGDTAERAALRDKANVALGYAWLGEDQAEAARPVLGRVSLDGPFSNQALLAAGWADAAAGRFREALSPWLELGGRNLLDAAVQESLLAVPYAYAELGAHGSAAKGYEAAIEAYGAEVARLDEAMAEIRRGDFLPAVLAMDDDDARGFDGRSGRRFFWQLDAVPDTVPSRYLYHLLADHAFQEGLRDLRDLDAMAARLTEWQGRLDALRDLVATQALRQEGVAPEAARHLDATDVGALRERYLQLAGRAARIESARDVAGLATDEELDQWGRLEAIGQRLAAAGDTPEAADLRERHRVLRGVLYWRLDREHRYRLWQQRTALAELDKLLDRTGRAALSATGAARGAPAALESHAARIEELAPRLDALSARLAEARRRQSGRLVALAGEALGRQRERLHSYRLQARFALANIHDRASSFASASPAGGERAR